MRRSAVLFWLGLLLTVAGAIGAAWAAGELTNGVFEILGHWWSSLVVAPAIVGLALLVASRRAWGSDQSSN